MQAISACRAWAAVGVSALVVLAGLPAQASDPLEPAVRTITAGLNGPYGLDILSTRTALVAERDSGAVTAVDLRSGAKKALISGLAGSAGLATTGGRIYVLQGGGGTSGKATPPPSKYPPSSLLEADSQGGHVRVLADFKAYELAHNPDGQVQFAPNGTPYDALSNPFSMTASSWGLLVADGGANDVLRVDPSTGTIATYFVPPTAKTPACLAKGAQANPGTVGCDPVPTGVTQVGRYVYVSTLGAESPGASAIWKLDGRVLHVWTGFTALTGIAVTPGGAIYVSEVLFGAPKGNGSLPAGFDPAGIGRLTQVDGGRVTHAAVTMPTGLRYVNGHLYASSWSIAGKLQIPHAGKVVEVSPRAFK